MQGILHHLLEAAQDLHIVPYLLWGNLISNHLLSPKNSQPVSSRTNKLLLPSHCMWHAVSAKGMAAKQAVAAGDLLEPTDAVEHASKHKKKRRREAKVEPKEAEEPDFLRKERDGHAQDLSNAADLELQANDAVGDRLPASVNLLFPGITWCLQPSNCCLNSTMLSSLSTEESIGELLSGNQPSRGGAHCCI